VGEALRVWHELAAVRKGTRRASKPRIKAELPMERTPLVRSREAPDPIV
jgi:hypothetical protein